MNWPTTVSKWITSSVKTQFSIATALFFILINSTVALCISRTSGSALAPLATGTITFASDAGAAWNDGIAEDGEGGSTNLAGIVIQTKMISDANGTNLGVPISWKNKAELSTTENFSALTTYNAAYTFTGWLGFEIKSADGAEFKIDGFRWYDWGGYTGEAVNVIGYRNGSQVASTSFLSNTDGSIITVALGTAFGDVDDVRIMFSSGAGWGSINDIQIANPVPLPVTLISLKAAMQENNVNLTWQTSQETNASDFEIQRSNDAKTFFKVGSVAAKGESTTVAEYNFLDQMDLGVKQSGLYYRLKMNDKDGTFAFSRIQRVNIPESDLSFVYPNPASDRLYLNDKEPGETRSVSLVNEAGHMIYQTPKIGKDGITINGFLPGIYIVKITKSNGAERSQKVVIR